MAVAFPMGVRFHPSDEEKVAYLVQFVSTGVQCDKFIKIGVLYGEKWEIFGNYNDGVRERYFFTKLKKIGKKTGTRYSCNVGKGTWSNKGQKTPIYGRRRRAVIGYKRCFRYERRKDDVDDDRNEKWLLKEYILPDLVNCCQVREEYRDYALCVLKKKAGSNEKEIMIREPFDQEGMCAPMDDNMMIGPYQTILADKTDLITIRDDDQTCFNGSMIMTPHDLVSPCRILAGKTNLVIIFDDDRTYFNQIMMMPRDLVVCKETDDEEEKEGKSAPMDDNMIGPYQMILADEPDLIIISDDGQTHFNGSMMTPYDFVVRKDIDDEEEVLNEFFNFTLPADDHFLSDDHFVWNDPALPVNNCEPFVASDYVQIGCES